MIEQVLDLKETALHRIRDAGSAEWMGHHYAFSYLPHLLGDPGSIARAASPVLDVARA